MYKLICIIIITNMQYFVYTDTYIAYIMQNNIGRPNQKDKVSILYCNMPFSTLDKLM